MHIGIYITCKCSHHALAASTNAWCKAANKHSAWRQEFLGCGSENLEQSTRLTAAA